MASQAPSNPAVEEYTTAQRLDRLEKAMSALLKIFNQPDLPSHGTSQDIESLVVLADRVANTAVPKVPKPIKYKPGPPIDGPYVYQPLDATKSEIRLLALHQTERDEQAISGQLVTISLDGVAALGGKNRLVEMYTTLSYTWGDPKMDHVINVDGHAFAVTANLESALRNMRRRKREALDEMYGGLAYERESIKDLWWIDQICINQADIDERSQQVNLMRRIYRKSQSVAVWLGDASDDSDVAMSLLNQLGSPPVRGPGEKAIEYPVFTAQETDRKWRALAALFARPWWERSWVQQEVTLPTTAAVHCGTATCDLTHIELAVTSLRYLGALGYTPSFAPPAYAHAEALTALRTKAANGMCFVDLLALLAHTRSCRATDARDKVYSILGLADPEAHAIPVDYRMSVHDIFITTAQTALVGAESRFDLLGLAQNPERRHGLPSLVPNLLDEWKTRPFPPNEHLQTTSSVEKKVWFEGGRVLVAKGFHLDRVALICPDVVQANMTPDQLQGLWDAWMQFLRSAFERRALQQEEWTLYAKPNFKHKQWHTLLTAGNTTTHYVVQYSSTGDGVPHSERELTYEFRGINFKLTKASLLPEGLQLDIHPLRVIHDAMKRYGAGRCLGITANGSVGLFPADVLVGDLISVLHGASYPYVLRWIKDLDNVLVGECSVPGYRQGMVDSAAASEKFSINTTVRMC